MWRIKKTQIVSFPPLFTRLMLFFKSVSCSVHSLVVFSMSPIERWSLAIVFVCFTRWINLIDGRWRSDVSESLFPFNSDHLCTQEKAVVYIESCWWTIARKPVYRSKRTKSKWDEINIAFDIHATGEEVAIDFDVLRINPITIITITDGLIVLIPAVDLSVYDSSE